MLICENGLYREATKEENEKAEQDRKQEEKNEFHRQLSQEEVLNIFITQQVNNLSVDDETSLKMKQYYPKFEDIAGKTVPKGFKFTYNGELFKVACGTELTIQEIYPPSINTAYMYEAIPEMYLGNQYDPIPYNGNMKLEQGKYYTQENVIYKCINNSGNKVFDKLSVLVNIFVEGVNKE